MYLNLTTFTTKVFMTKCEEFVNRPGLSSVFSFFLEQPDRDRNKKPDVIKSRQMASHRRERKDKQMKCTNGNLYVLRIIIIKNNFFGFPTTT